MSRARQYGWTCPHCGGRYDAAAFPDYWSCGVAAFHFKCDCGEKFGVDIEYDPTFVSYKIPPAWVAK